MNVRGFSERTRPLKMTLIEIGIGVSLNENASEPRLETPALKTTKQYKALAEDLVSISYSVQISWAFGNGKRVLPNPVFQGRYLTGERTSRILKY